MPRDQEFYPSNGASGVAFGLGLLAGAAIGIGIGLLFAPKEGTALRRDIARRARDLRDEAGERLEHVDRSRRRSRRSRARRGPAGAQCRRDRHARGTPLWRTARRPTLRTP